MMRPTLQKKSPADRLVAQFAEIAIAQDRATLYNEIAKFNRLFDRANEIEQELQARPGDERHLLMALYDHENTQVRLSAAMATLAIAPQAARGYWKRSRRGNRVYVRSMRGCACGAWIAGSSSRNDSASGHDASSTQDASSADLVARYAEIGIEQDRALLYNEIAKFNRLFDRARAIEEELKSRPQDERRLLTSLYDHESTQVRVNAAKATLAVAPQAARQVLEAIAARKSGVSSLSAGMCLARLDSGEFKPK